MALCVHPYLYLKRSKVNAITKIFRTDKLPKGEHITVDICRWHIYLPVTSLPYMVSQTVH